MATIYYVDETDGTVLIHTPNIGHPYRSFSEQSTAYNYSKMIKARLKTEKSSGSSSASSSSGSSSSGSGCLVVLLAVAIIGFFGFKKVSGFIKNAAGMSDGFVATKIEVNEYAKIESEPLDKQIGVISADTVFKLKKVTKTKNVTWLEVYKLENGNPVVTYLLLPEVVKDIQKENKYLSYNEKSRTWQEYFDKIDAKNSALLHDIQNKFSEEIKSIEISHSSDNVLKESVKSTSFIFDKDGYFDLYKSDGTDFYYINKDDKDEFMNAYKTLEKEYKTQKKEYFPK